jgi:hypothetical protein
LVIVGLLTILALLAVWVILRWRRLLHVGVVSTVWTVMNRLVRVVWVLVVLIGVRRRLVVWGRLLHLGLVHHQFEGIKQLLFVDSTIRILIDRFYSLQSLLLVYCDAHIEGLEQVVEKEGQLVLV